MKSSKIYKMLQKSYISFSKHAKNRLKERYWINKNVALQDILSTNAIISELDILWRIEVISNWRIYILSSSFIVVTVK